MTNHYKKLFLVIQLNCNNCHLNLFLLAEIIVTHGCRFFQKLKNCHLYLLSGSFHTVVPLTPSPVWGFIFFSNFNNRESRRKIKKILWLIEALHSRNTGKLPNPVFNPIRPVKAVPPQLLCIICF